MTPRALDQTFREHEGDDFVAWLDRAAPVAQPHGRAAPRAASPVAAVSRWLSKTVGLLELHRLARAVTIATARRR